MNVGLFVIKLSLVDSQVHDLTLMEGTLSLSSFCSSVSNLSAEPVECVHHIKSSYFSYHLSTALQKFS